MDPVQDGCDDGELGGHWGDLRVARVSVRRID
jgi:hypothetical protein